MQAFADSVEAEYEIVEDNPPPDVDTQTPVDSSESAQGQRSAPTTAQGVSKQTHNEDKRAGPECSTLHQTIQGNNLTAPCAKSVPNETQNGTNVQDGAGVDGSRCVQEKQPTDPPAPPPMTDDDGKEM